jgi:hypothetical protein
MPVPTLGQAAPTYLDDDDSVTDQSILTLTGEVDVGDRQLGDLLKTLELIDGDTLTALLLEARRQRRSLRHLLLAGDYLTLYQMALIEAGNLDGLILGPVRVIDRLHSAAHEAVYRVFDPRHNREAVLRHLGEAVMHDAVRPDEFRQRFGAAEGVRDVHVAATYEVLEILGRPAALQELFNGLPAPEWPALAAAPGVWFRLISQAAVGLRALHAAGQVHGHLDPACFVMTPEGVLKIRGLGEPAWLCETQYDADPKPTADLLRLGRAAAQWAAAGAIRRTAKTRPLPEPLQALLNRLTGEGGAVGRIGSATELLNELERLGAEAPANAAAWERFLHQIREQSADRALRPTG